MTVFRVVLSSPRVWGLAMAAAALLVMALPPPAAADCNGCPGTDYCHSMVTQTGCISTGTTVCTPGRYYMTCLPNGPSGCAYWAYAGPGPCLTTLFP